MERYNKNVPTPSATKMKNAILPGETLSLVIIPLSEVSFTSANPWVATTSPMPITVTDPFRFLQPRLGPQLPVSDPWSTGLTVPAQSLSNRLVYLNDLPSVAIVVKTDYAMVGFHHRPELAGLLSQT